MSLKLIGTATSPFARKVRVVMAEKKLDCEFVVDDLQAAEPLVRRFNPLGKVPCLVIDDKESVFDSRVIVEYLDTLSPVSRLIPAPGPERLDVKIWEALADGLLDAIILARYEQTWANRKDSERCQAWIDYQMHKVDAALDAMSARLADRSWCIAGAHPTLADIAVGCALGYLDLRFPAVAWRDRHANLAQLLDERLVARASFLDTRPA